MAANFQDVANQFVPFYYQTFDGNREALAALYRDSSMLTYESASVIGVAAIVDKLKVGCIFSLASVAMTLVMTPRVDVCCAHAFECRR